jgi:hypothetical protein
MGSDCLIVIASVLIASVIFGLYLLISYLEWLDKRARKRRLARDLDDLLDRKWPGGGME